MLVKVCGVRDLDELKASQSADLIGVVVKSRSPKSVSMSRAKELIESSPRPVALVSDTTSFRDWLEVLQAKPHAIQVHSPISPDEFNRLRRLFRGTLIKSFIVPPTVADPEAEASRLARLMELYDADYYLIDSGSASGRQHDLRVSRLLAPRYPIIVAGGLNPDNVRFVVRYVRPAGVDASSGLERLGRKDPEKVAKFVEEAKRAAAVEGV
ncbi:N-(5'-phosphoribosyl)anthranilate isomerase [Candidatus Geothermarchaeota archaeon ex4572_27]|nr:MAG: N-(5'-phosphoribosyl)anthranilate isomerase [Candidatus Geothermarchaeota archaeon ex4572_27]